MAWASAEQACDGYRTRCFVGRCNVDGSSESPDGGLALGTCPSVVADGQPCTEIGGPAPGGPTCDTFGECFRSVPSNADANGTCTVLDGTICR